MDLIPPQFKTSNGRALFDEGSFARSLNGSGIDRIVPIGQALAFGRFWDGYDLLAEFTRSTLIQ
jgi:hypothetical protein